MRINNFLCNIRCVFETCTSLLLKINFADECEADDSDDWRLTIFVAQTVCIEMLKIIIKILIIRMMMSAL